MNRFLYPVLAFLFFLVAVAIYVFLSWQISVKVDAAVVAKTSAAGLGEEESFQKTLNTLLAQTQSERQALEPFVAADTDVVSRITAIEGAGTRDKVSVSIGTVGVAESSWHYHEPLRITFSAKGSFQALAQFATDIESLPEASHLVSMSEEASADHTWFATFTVDFLKVKTASTTPS